MTTIRVTVEDENAELVKKLLQGMSYIKNIEEENNEIKQGNTGTVLARIQKLLDQAKGKNLFSDINDPVEWQRELRKEWDRDY